MRIVVVGGGAGGLELATRLGNVLGRKKQARITLIDRNAVHIWKPLLHEVATGSLDTGGDALSYRAHARAHGFEFVLGNVAAVDRTQRVLTLAPLHDQDGDSVLPERTLAYDHLVVAAGARTNDFGTPGVSTHCFFLDQAAQAERFRQKLLNGFLRLNQRLEHEPDTNLNVAIVGGGATGIELAAELFNAAELIKAYGLERVTLDHLKVTLLEAGDRLLPALPDRIAASVHKELVALGVDVRTGARVVQASAEGMAIASGDFLPSDLMVWAAGVKAPGFVRELSGLEHNRVGQVVVNAYLQPAEDDRLTVIGDSSACPNGQGGWIPPRAQAAHQMAELVGKNLIAGVRGGRARTFRYRDHGSLISLSRYRTVGSLMGNLTRGSMMVEGRFARVAYISLYRMHQIALHGWVRTLLIVLVGSASHALKPRLKLH